MRSTPLSWPNTASTTPTAEYRAAYGVRRTATDSWPAVTPTTSSGPCRSSMHCVPKVRAPEQQSFDNAKKFGMEVFKDENTGGLMYITEKGGLATGKAPKEAPDPKKIIPPKTAYGLVLRVRGADEADFTEKTKRVRPRITSCRCGDPQPASEPEARE